MNTRETQPWRSRPSRFPRLTSLATHRRRKARRLDLRDVLKPIDEEASKAFGRDFEYPENWMSGKLWLLNLAILVCIGPVISHAAENSGAAASDPTAAVNYQDFRFRYFDRNEGNERQSFETEGAFMLRPRLKITNDLRYVDDNSSGKSEQDFNQLKIKGIFLNEIKPFGVNAKLAVGIEWLKDLGDFEEGTGTGADQIAPLIGIGWVPDDKNFIVTLVQYFHSYETDNSFQGDVRQTAPRLIWIRSLADIGGWFKADLKMSIDHEDDENFDQTLELQLGKMISPKWGFYGEVLVGDEVLDSNAYNLGAGIGIRMIY